MATASLPSWVEPELATLTRDRFSDPDWIFERKLDGERCLAFCGPDGIQLKSRNKRDLTTTFPEVAEALEARRQDGDRDGLVLDGEIVAFDGEQTRFERLQHRLGLVNPDPELVRSVPVVYHMFDVMFAEGEDTRPRPLLERKEILRRVISYRDPLRYTEHRVGDGEACYAQACHDGWEGLIAKVASAPYVSGRNKNWLKFKCESGQELVVGGFTDPQRSRVGFGALLLGYYNAGGELVYAGKVGTGFDNETLRSLRARLGKLERGSSPFQAGPAVRERGVHWVKPELVAEVGFSEWTDAGELRHPRFQGLRDDKSAREVVREVPS
jgi:bifunctional non-homologous end joining protein LigD